MIDTRSISLAAVGDGLVGPLVHAGRGTTGLERYFISNRFINWLRVIMPNIDLAETAVFGRPGETTVAVVERLPSILQLDPLPRGVLICAGSEDCMRTIRGVAPAPNATVAALENIASQLLVAGVAPIFIIPPPCVLFSNGLFADRFVAIAATLRRMSAQDDRVRLIDPINVLMKPHSFGIEPDPRYVSPGADGRLSSLGALRLAEEVAKQLRCVLPQLVIRNHRVQNLSGALNKNPNVTGSGGKISVEAASGRCATEYSLDVHQLGGAAIRATASGGPERLESQRLTFSGLYTTTWGFFRMSQMISADVVDQIAVGDILEAVCEFELAGKVTNIAAVSLDVTAVWKDDCIGLHSSRYVGGAGVSEPHGGQLRTPQFSPPVKLKKLNVSLQINLVPGTNLNASGHLDIHSIALRKIERAAVSVNEPEHFRQQAEDKSHPEIPEIGDPPEVHNVHQSTEGILEPVGRVHFG